MSAIATPGQEVLRGILLHRAPQRDIFNVPGGTVSEIKSEEYYCNGGKGDNILLTQHQQARPDSRRGAEFRLPDQDASFTRRVPGH